MSQEAFPAQPECTHGMLDSSASKQKKAGALCADLGGGGKNLGYSSRSIPKGGTFQIVENLGNRNATVLFVGNEIDNY